MAQYAAADVKLMRHAGRECLVSVIIVSWNTRALLRTCLASTLEAAHVLGRPVEVIVVDNASTDGTPYVVSTEFPTVRLVQNTSNVGFAAANNQGIRASSGRYLLLLNPDTKTTPGFLRVLVGFLESHSDAAAAGPRLVGGDGEQQVSCFLLPTLGRELWRLLHFDCLYHFGTYPVSRWRGAAPQEVESIQGACMLLRREALNQTGLLDERFFVYTEELDLCRRLRNHGWHIFWVPEAVIVHYGGASTSQIEGRMFLELYRTKVQYFRKHFGAWGAAGYKGVLLVAALPRVVVTPLAMAIVPSRRQQWRGLVRNYTSLLVQLFAF